VCPKTCRSAQHGHRQSNRLRAPVGEGADCTAVRGTGLGSCATGPTSCTLPWRRHSRLSGQGWKPNGRLT
jgi:hypothetical protein